ncbi:reverse transcriptase [Senna tora]|uniref:Reverse transcriptase n=1 Tax=Senna tora TaxID=362788 RepID=A0A834SGX5_9FABA|nr:reverse transcriptase [Senna tora]
MAKFLKVDIANSHPLFPIIRACRSLMEGQLSISLNHAFRESNQCADLLAKKALLDQIIV